jgi:hypothetical protein
MNLDGGGASSTANCETTTEAAKAKRTLGDEARQGRGGNSGLSAVERIVLLNLGKTWV